LRRRGPEDGAGDAPKEEQDTVDQKTRQALKKDKFVSTTTQSLEWASEHRQSVMTATWIVLGLVVAAIAGGLVYNMRSDAAAAAFGAAMQVYQSPLTQPGEPVPPGAKAFATSADRAKGANALFLAIADKYGMTPSGANARYFAGLTYNDAGETQQAEDALKRVAGGWNKNLAALAKFSLAQLYRNSGRDPQAIDLYNQLSAKPTTTVPYGLAQLQLAELYQSEGNAKQAKDIYAALKDKDAKGPAGAIAAEKLNPEAAGPQMRIPQ
jgi:tetratricopeptide (TPR) repeat protein